MTDQIPTSEVLNRAADVIERDGWHQGGYSPAADTPGAPLTGRPVCALGAILVAANEPLIWSVDLDCWFGGPCPTANAAAEVVSRYLTGQFIPAWNDKKVRTAAEVIEALRAAALIEAARENTSTRESVSSR